MSDKVAKTSDINFKVSLDENNVPLNIQWEAEDAGEKSDSKAMMVSLWDEKEENTLRIDLWTKEMRVDEMKKFFHQTILTMADTFERATGEDGMSEEMRRFGQYFAEKLNLIAK